MTAPGLSGIVTDLVALVFGTPLPPTAVTAVGGGLASATILWGFIKLMKKIAIPSMLDAYARIEHVRGRNRAQGKIANALAERGSPSDLIQGLSVLGRTSPMDAPGASLYVGGPPTAVIPDPRSPALGDDAMQRVVIADADHLARVDP
jgi:hypothetical protein